MAGAYPTMGARPQRPEETAELAVLRDARWRGGFGMPFFPAGPFVYPFPQVPPPQDALVRWGWHRPEESFVPVQVRPQIPEEAVARPAVEPGGYTVDELLGGNVRRRTGMNSNVPAAGK